MTNANNNEAANLTLAKAIVSASRVRARFSVLADIVFAVEAAYDAGADDRQVADMLIRIGDKAALVGRYMAKEMARHAAAQAPAPVVAILEPLRLAA